MSKPTISEAIDARIFALKQAQEERDLQLVVEDLEEGGFTGSVLTSYVLKNPRGLDIAISVKRSPRPEHAKPITLLVEVGDDHDPSYRFRLFQVHQREAMLEYIIGEISNAEFI